jgi:ELWxxDGT repeat protein
VGPLPSWPTEAAVLGGLLVLALSDTVHGWELWRTDGTAAGTLLVLDIHPAGDSSPTRFTRVGSKLVFWADDGAHGSELWVTDGTAAGTALLKDINPGPAGSPGFRSTVLGSTAFFFAFDGVHGYEPWKTDGTGPGTVLVRDVAPGPAGSMLVESFAAAGHEVFFTASDHVAGRELWRSDGTEAGTTRVTDLVPGLVGGAIPFFIGANRTVLARSGGRVFFTATDGTTGYELWSVPVPTQFHTVVPCRVADTRDPAGPTGGASPVGDARLPGDGPLRHPVDGDLRRRQRHRRLSVRGGEPLGLRGRARPDGTGRGFLHSREDAGAPPPAEPRLGRHPLRPTPDAPGKRHSRPRRRERLVRVRWP